MITTAKFFQLFFFSSTYFLILLPGAWGLHGGFLINYYILGSKKSREGNLKKNVTYLIFFWLYIGSKKFYLCPKLLSLENPFEFIWNLKYSFKTLKFDLNLKKVCLVCHGPLGVVQCACIQPYHMINLNTRTWHHSSGFMFEINFQTG